MFLYGNAPSAKYTRQRFMVLHLMVHFIVVDKTKLSTIFGLLIAPFEVHTDWLAPEIALLISRCIQLLSGTNTHTHTQAFTVKFPKTEIIFRWNDRNCNRNTRPSTGSRLWSSNFLLLHRKFISSQKTNFISVKCPNDNKKKGLKKFDLICLFTLSLSPVLCCFDRKKCTQKDCCWNCAIEFR